MVKYTKGIAIARDIAIPIGIIGTLIGFVNMLSNLDDPSTLGPAIGISFLTTLYGLILFVLCNIAVSQFPDENIEKQESIILQNGIAAGSIYDGAHGNEYRRSRLSFY